MTRTHRVRRSYDHRLRDAIAATGNANLFRDVAIPASTRRTWVRGEVRPVVASVNVYELWEQVDNLRQRAKVQAAVIGLLVRVVEAARRQTRRRSRSRWGNQIRRFEGDFVESETYRHVAVQNLALYAQRLG